MTYDIPLTIEPAYVVLVPEVVYWPPATVWYPCTACEEAGGYSRSDSTGRRWETCWCCGGKGGRVGM